ncbi:hypothetical protein [Tabrizicola sp.]|uniref:hypothetical protein n=1 Tax=Tabrizicola sp. TaxID=2005166 RepID=UPI001A3E7D9D|nr:hypothetical protein [Tabrizicola sp.]MBL9062592.1 hypothetical protein [Tabrizicola sp.]
MDKLKQDNGSEVLEGSAPSLNQPPSAGKSLLLPWLALGAVALLIIYGKNNDSSNQPDGRDARLERANSTNSFPDHSAAACSAWGKLAEQAMRVRQAGGSKADLLEVISSSDNAENRVFARAIVDDAYNSALHSDPVLQAASVIAFGAAVEDMCSNAG